MKQHDWPYYLPYTYYITYIYYAHYTIYIKYLRRFVSTLEMLITGKPEAMAATVVALGDKFKPKLRAGWLAYIRETYPDGAVEAAQSVGEEPLVLHD